MDSQTKVKLSFLGPICVKTNTKVEKCGINKSIFPNIFKDCITNKNKKNS